MTAFPEDEGDICRMTVPPEAKGERLDAYLATILHLQSRSYIQKLIRDDMVSLASGASIKPSTKLAGGEDITVFIPEPVEMAAEPEAMELDILYEDEHMVVVNKAAGVVVHPSPGHEQGALVNGLLHHCGDLSGIGGILRPGIVHRLDMETTGAIVIAKHDVAHRAIAEQFAMRTTQKTYLALSHNVPNPPEGRIEGNIGRHPRHRQIMAVVTEGGRSAETFYETAEDFGDIACVLAYPKTGRTHQIRVHMAHIGCPLLCDPFYGREKVMTRAMLAGTGVAQDDGEIIISRHMLHAKCLELDHPISGKRMIFEAPVPEDMRAALRILRSR